MPPWPARYSIHRQNGLVSGTSKNRLGGTHGGGTTLGSRRRPRKTAICSRVTGLFGQKLPLPQPVTTLLRNSSSHHEQNGLEAGRSEKTGVPQAGGVSAGSSARSTNTQSCSRVTGLDGQ